MDLRCTTFLLLLSFLALAHGKLRVKRSSARACKEGESVWSDDCNTCLCFKGRVFCTKYECHRFPNSHNKIQDIEEQCESGTRWKVGCQTCFCTVEGIPKCTNYRCEGVESLFRKKREFITDLKRPETKQSCQPGFSTNNGCNTITCSESGQIMTTLMLCENFDFKKKVPVCEEGKTWKLKGYDCICKNGNGECKREKADVRNKRSIRPDIGTTKFCQPGFSWHDGCNSQGCNEDGTIHSTIMSCPPSKINENVAICEKGSTWEHKGKKCHCTDKGFGECQVAKKRSVRATIVEDSSEEEENRKRKKEGRPQLFCQPDFTWFDGCGHYKCNEGSQVVHIRGDCDGGDDDPKRNKKVAKCKDGEKWGYAKSSLKCECKNGIGECK